MRTMTLLSIAFVALVVAAPAASAAIAPPQRIALFDDGNHVDTATATSESDALQATLRDQGHTVTTFTGTTAAAFTMALADADVLVVPEQEIAPLAPALGADARAVVRGFIESGGGFLAIGTFADRAASLVNAVSGRALDDDLIGSDTSLVAANAAGTPFAGGPATLPSLSLTTAAALTGLGPGEAIYADDTRASVAVLSLGSGRIGYLGWDWNAARPTGTQDGGWLTVLDRMLAHLVHQPGDGGLDCDSGYEQIGDSCVDIDECLSLTVANGTCVNTPGGYTISCDSGFELDPSTNICVEVATPDLCLLTKQFIQSSTRYQALPPSLRTTADQLGNALCAKLALIVPRLTPAQKTSLILAYKRLVQALVPLGWLTPAQAATLSTLASDL